MERQFARTPYTVSFRRLDKGFTLVTLHVYYATKNTPEKRTPELKRISAWLRDNAEDPDEFNRNLIALGDFNIDRRDDPNWHAFVSDDGPLPPYELLDLPRTVGETPGKNSYYDQIAWFSNPQAGGADAQARDCRELRLGRQRAQGACACPRRRRAPRTTIRSGRSSSSTHLVRSREER